MKDNNDKIEYPLKNENLNKGHRGRLRQRFFEKGLDAFSAHEVVELILTFAYPRRDTKVLAKKALDHFEESLHKLFYAKKEELNKAGLSDTAATLIKLCRETFIYQMKKKLIKKNYLTSSDIACEYLKCYYKGIPHEEFYVIYLDQKNNIINAESVFEGTINETKVYTRELIKSCLKKNAASIIIAHNHPSGSVQPSNADINITDKIKNALNLLDIRLLDHIVIGDNQSYSFSENNLISDAPIENY